MMRTDVRSAREAAWRVLNNRALVTPQDITALANGFLDLDEEVKYDG